jgi:rhodanese-related sulfurtransferase
MGVKRPGIIIISPNYTQKDWIMKHSQGFLNIVNDAKSRIREVNVAETQQRMSANSDVKLIDVREDNEWDEAHAAGSIHLGKGIIERDIENTVPDKDTELILYCGGGYRSALAADVLQKMGYTNVFSMAGGWKAWKENGGKIEKATDDTDSR